MMNGVVQLALFDVRKQLIAAHKHGCEQESRIAREIKNKEGLYHLKDLLYHIHGEDIM